jgi:hypothetical protein
MLASAESLLGSIWFGVMLGLIGAVAGFVYCRKGKGKA